MIATGTKLDRNTADVAELLGCGPRKVRKLATELGVGYGIGGKAGYRYSDDDVQKMLAALRPTAVVERRRRRRRNT